MLEFNEDGSPALDDHGNYRRSRPRKRVPYAAADIKDGNKIIVRAFDKIDADVAKKIEALALDTLDVLYINNYIVATLDQEGSAITSKETA